MYGCTGVLTNAKDVPGEVDIRALAYKEVENEKVAGLYNFHSLPSRNYFLYIHFFYLFINCI